MDNHIAKKRLYGFHFGLGLSGTDWGVGNVLASSDDEAIEIICEFLNTDYGINIVCSGLDIRDIDLIQPSKENPWLTHCLYEDETFISSDLPCPIPQNEQVQLFGFRFGVEAGTRCHGAVLAVDQEDAKRMIMERFGMVESLDISSHENDFPNLTLSYWQS